MAFDEPNFLVIFLSAALEAVDKFVGTLGLKSFSQTQNNANF
jgi:hypothetical protein